ncbi:hypothetical protein Tco_0934377, partial [Tanacetum coccineum]
HPSDTNVFTMKMEILLEPASNKLASNKLLVKTVVTLSQSTKVNSLPHIHAHSTKTNNHESSRFKDKDFRKLRSEAFKMRHNMRMLVKDLRSQDGIDVKDNVKGSRVKIAKHEGTSLQQRTRSVFNELTLGEIVSLKILSQT